MIVLCSEVIVITKIPSEQDMSMYSNMHNDVQLFVGLQYRLSESFSAVTHHIKSLCCQVSYQFNKVQLSETGCSKDGGISNAWCERCHKTGRFFCWQDWGCKPTTKALLALASQGEALSESGNEQKQWGQKCFKYGHWKGKPVMYLYLPVQ